MVARLKAERKAAATARQEKEAGARQLQQRTNEAAARAREEVARAAVPPLRRSP